MFESWLVRTEVWHALSVHFPIALLVFSTLAMLVCFIIRSDAKKYWYNAASGLLYAGCVAAWIAIYTGNLADGIVARKICDPTVLKDHEIAAQTMTYLFSAATALNLLLAFKVINTRLTKISSYIILVLMLTGSGYLLHAGHLGASLVYQQGAGVYNHSIECDDF